MTNIITITSLTKHFETAAKGSLRNGQPPFSEILAEMAKLSPSVQSDVLTRIASVWATAGDACQSTAALQFTRLVDQPWFNRDHAARLMTITRTLAAHNARLGHDWAVRAMRDAAHHDCVLVSLIDKGVQDARNRIETPAKLRVA